MRAVRPVVQQVLGRSSPLNRPLLETTAGGMLGTQVQVSDGQNVCAYFSVPFAEPPVARLRFEVSFKKYGKFYYVLGAGSSKLCFNT
jgi:hypothetical protein